MSAACSSWSRQVVFLLLYSEYSLESAAARRTNPHVVEEKCLFLENKSFILHLASANSHAWFYFHMYAIDVQRLRVGSIRDGTRRPDSLLTHADIVAALHRCKYDPASAEASLIALARRRESKYNSASSSSEVRALGANGNADLAEGTGVAGEPDGSDAATAGKSARKFPKYNSTRLGDGPPGGKDDKGGNRWEDWSEEDRATFLLQLGDKVRGILVVYLVDFFFNHTGHWFSTTCLRL